MPKNSFSFFGACLLPTIALILIGMLLGLGAVLSIPGQAAKTFGLPTPGLGLWERVHLSTLLLLQSNDLTKPVNSLGTPLPFRVELGESVPSVTGRLYQAGLIPNPAAFRSYLRYAGLDTNIQAGDYTLSPAVPPIEIALALQDATPASVTFHMLAGWRLEEVAAALPTSGLTITPQEFLAAARTQPEGYSFSSELGSGDSLEGFLFPDAYELPREMTARALITIMLARFDAQVNTDIRTGFQQQGLTLRQAVILASIVERETMVDDEMPLIASVYLNRHNISMKLDADPTIQYALGWNTAWNSWWKAPLSLDDLQFDSPYNTYRQVGLPPGPICSPGLAALRAVAFPAQTPYYYFRVACDGSHRHVFAETFEQQLKNACP